ncbi:MAG: hypothetical protein WC429_09410 [Verrucomicrobiia bacterium]
MNQQTYKYDVAFSFLQEDEALAQQLNDLLKGRLVTFIYTERQKGIAGTDGEQTFNRVFSQETRIVVILHRSAWGTRGWTQVEQTAIRNRGFEKGYDFTILIPMSQPIALPEWFPKNRIWADLERWGVEGAVVAIEQRVRDAGGTPREETAENKAARLSRLMVQEQTTREFLGSEKGVRCAWRQVQELFAEIERICGSISAAGGKTIVGVHRQPNQSRECTIFCCGYMLHVRWENQYINTLNYAALQLEMTHQDSRHREPVSMFEETFKFGGSNPDDVEWLRNPKDNRHFSTKQMAEYCVKTLLETLEKEKPWQER